jgi:hypothetical protein
MSTQPPITPGGGDENVDPDDPQPSAFESLLRHVAHVPLKWT